MRNRRQFLQRAVGVGAGLFFLRDAVAEGLPQGALPVHKPVMIAGKKIKTVDVHAHVYVPEVTDFLKGTPLEGKNGSATSAGQYGDPPLVGGGERIQHMDKQGIDVQAVSVNVFWDSADRDFATRLIAFQNEKLAALIKAGPTGRFVAYGTVALKFPDLAAQQLEQAMNLGLKGASISGSVNGEEITTPEYDVFWSKAEELQAPIFMHPQDAPRATGIAKRSKGTGALGNAIGNPLETTLFLSHMIFDGVFERFPKLKVCCAHGGGFLAAYPDRMDHGCILFPDQCKDSKLQKTPSDYLKKNVYVDNIVFMPEEMRHLVAEMGSTHVMLGTDYPYPWTEKGPENITMGPVDLLLATPGLSDTQKIEILGGNACKWLNIAA